MVFPQGRSGLNWMKRVLPRGDRHILDGQLLQELLAGGGLLRLGGVGAEPLDEGLEVLRLLGGLAVLVLLLFQDELARLVPEVVVARVHPDLAEIDVRDVGADLVQEVAVMGNDDDRVREAAEEILQPGDGAEVQVVRRLVEEENVRIAEEGLGEKDAHLVPPVELLHLSWAERFGDAEAVEEHRRLGLGLVAVHLGEFRLQLRRADPVLFGEIGLGVDRLALGHHLVEPFVPHDDRVDDRLIIEGELVLAQDRDPLPGADGDLALVLLHIAGKDLEKGRFPGAVGADDAVAVPRRELDVDVFEQHPLAVGKGDVGNVDHASIPFRFLG